MADINDYFDLIDHSTGQPLKEKVHDNGDGTYTREVYAQNAGTGGGGADTQYADGTTNASPTGNAILWKDNSNVLHVASTANPLPVTGGGGGTQYSNASTQATPVGTAMLWVDASNVVHVPSPSQPLPIVATGTTAVSASSLPLPTGAATAAKQPALGTAGTAASDVLTVQGIASMTPFKTDGSATTQPVSGSVTTTGTVASGATDSGNPVKMGGVYHAAGVTFADGQRGDLQLDVNGLLKVTPRVLQSTGGTPDSVLTSFLAAPGTATAHRTGITAADSVDPTNPTTVGSAVHFTGNPGITTSTQNVDFDITLAGTGTCTAVVQLMFWDATAVAWYGGAVTYLTTAAVSSTIPTTPTANTCPCVLRLDVRGRTTYLKCIGISGTSATLAANYLTL